MRVSISVRPVISELKSAIEELFVAMSVKFLQDESNLALGIASQILYQGDQPSDIFKESTKSSKASSQNTSLQLVVSKITRWIS